MIIWVHDMIIAATDENIFNDMKTMLPEKFKMKDLCKLRHFLGTDFNQFKECITISQENYVNKSLQHFTMVNCRTRETPCDQKLEYTESSVKRSGIRLYKETVGSLIYLATSRIAQYLAEPTEEHWVTLKLLRYLKGTAERSMFQKKQCEARYTGL